MGDNQDLTKILYPGFNYKASNGKIHPVNIDESTRAIPIVDYDHHEIHAGSAYLATASTLADDGDFLRVMLKTPNLAKRPHIVLTIDSALAATLKAWRSNPGYVFNSATPVQIANRDHESANTSGMSICTSPLTNGVTLSNPQQKIYIGSTSVSGKTELGGGTSTRHEVKLARDTLYVWELVSRADSNALTIYLDWYEHTDKSN